MTDRKYLLLLCVTFLVSCSDVRFVRKDGRPQEENQVELDMELCKVRDRRAPICGTSLAPPGGYFHSLCEQRHRKAMSEFLRCMKDKGYTYNGDPYGSLFFRNQIYGR